MAAVNQDPLDQNIGAAAEELAHDVRRGARRVGRSVVNGAEALDKATRPSFSEQLGQTLRSLGENSSQTLNLTRDLLHDHPLASLLTAATVGIGVAKLIGVARSRR